MALTRAELIAAGVEIPGSSSAESFIPTGNTVPTDGLYLADTSTVAISTSSAEALRIDANGDILVADGNRMEIDEIRARDGDGLKLFDDAGNGIFVKDGGNVGIGASSPRGNLEVATSLTYGGSVDQSIYLGATNVNAAVDNGNTLAYRFLVSGDQGGQDLRIRAVTRNLGGANVEKDRITIDGGTGNVGIGTTSPGEALHVNGNIRIGATSTADDNADYYITTGGQLSIQANNAATQDGNYVGLLLAAGVSPNQSSVDIYGSSSSTFQHIRFRTNGDERARIDGSGRLLVGTTSASGNARIQASGPIQTGSIVTASGVRSYTASTSATDVFKVQMTGGHGAAEFTWFFIDGGYPNGAIVGKIYIAFRGSGNNILAVSSTSNTQVSVTNGPVTSLSWSASVYNTSHIKLSVTGTTTSGAGTIYIYGTSPSFAGLTPITNL